MAVQNFRFPPGIDRAISIDAERAAVHVIIVTTSSFQLLSFRRPISPAGVCLVLGRAIRGLHEQSRQRAFTIDVAGLGKG